MEFVNESGVEAGWTMGFERSGRELLIVTAKATFVIPSEPGEAPLATEQIKLTEADTFTDAPGLSAPVYESDYAHHRPSCDVLLNGSAYAPKDEAVRRTEVSIGVGSMRKVLAVVGHRVWESGVRGIRPGEAMPFEVMPISYDNAFGGVDNSLNDPQNVRTFLKNPVGRGFRYYKDKLDGVPLSNTEEVDREVVDPAGDYRPMALGALGRSWMPRARYAGTYDQDWLETRAPFWPDDFDYRYFQSAPDDQQVPYLKGGEEVVLQNLTPDGYAAFTIPTLPMPVWLIPSQLPMRRVDAVIDTLVIEPDLGRFTLTWRVTAPMRRSCFDMKRVIVGEMSMEWQRAQRYGNKPYYKGLSELARARAQRQRR